MPLDYVTLRLIWWILLGVLIISFAITDGFDLGIGIILHRVSRTEEERCMVLNSIAPIWEGNQIWLILAAGAIFAAWPEIYAVSFSGFYFAMLMVLFALILRPVGFKYRNKMANSKWRSFWDTGIFIAGFVPTLLFGVAVGNVIQGVPFYYDANLQSYYTGKLITLLNPFGLLCGVLAVFMFVMHGGIFLGIKTTGLVQHRAANYARISALLMIIAFIIGGVWVSQMDGYVITSQIIKNGFSNPLHKTVLLHSGAWLGNYQAYPWMLLAPIIGIVAAFIAMVLITYQYFKLALLASALSISGIIATYGLSMFPFILPSKTHPNMSLLVWDASSSQVTLFIMLIASIILLPIITAYSSWVYYVLRGKAPEVY